MANTAVEVHRTTPALAADSWPAFRGEMERLFDRFGFGMNPVPPVIQHPRINVQFSGKPPNALRRRHAGDHGLLERLGETSSLLSGHTRSPFQTVSAISVSQFRGSLQNADAMCCFGRLAEYGRFRDSWSACHPLLSAFTRGEIFSRRSLPSHLSGEEAELRATFHRHANGAVIVGRRPTLVFGTVEILSSNRRQAARKPFRSFASSGRRTSGASVSSVVKARTAMAAVASKLSS
jgi:hypothetical protein